MNFVRVCLVLLLGFAAGLALHQPVPVRAAAGVTLKEVHTGYNPGIGSDEVIAFSCTNGTCYVLSR